MSTLSQRCERRGAGLRRFDRLRRRVPSLTFMTEDAPQRAPAMTGINVPPFPPPRRGERGGGKVHVAEAVHYLYARKYITGSSSSTPSTGAAAFVRCHRCPPRKRTMARSEIRPSTRYTGAPGAADESGQATPEIKSHHWLPASGRRSGIARRARQTAGRSSPSH